MGLHVLLREFFGRAGVLVIRGILLSLALSLAACGARSSLIVPRTDASLADSARPDTTQSGLQCGAAGYCTTTHDAHTAMFGGLAGGDAICQREYPGSHFYRRSCDATRRFMVAVERWPSGYGDTESGDCANCVGWTSPSGPFDPALSTPGCEHGYATTAALVPSPLATWRTCESGGWPLTCCVPE